EREGCSELGIGAEHVAAAKPEMKTGAVHVFVGVLQDNDSLASKGADAARVDVAADVVVPADADLDAPRVVGGRARLCLRSRGCTEHEDGHDAGDRLLSELRCHSSLL